MFSNKGDFWIVYDWQLGAMLAEEAQKEKYDGIHPVLLAGSNTSSAAQVILAGNGYIVIADQVMKDDGKTIDVTASYQDATTLDSFWAILKDGVPITNEFENTPRKTLIGMKERWFAIRPSDILLHTTKHRIREKEAINKIMKKSVTATYEGVTSFEEAKTAFAKFGKWRIKTCEDGYDGKGQWEINSLEDIEKVFTDIWKDTADLVYEENVDFAKEVSVTVIRNPQWQMECLPIFLNHHEWGILRTTEIWDDSVQEIEQEARDMAMKIAEGLWMEWVLTVEMFVTKDGKLLVNEVAPRAHNSWHIAEATCNIGQPGAWLEAILGKDITKPELLRRWRMTNIIGDDINQYPNIDWSKWGTTKVDKNTSIVSYWKGSSKPGRKMWDVRYTY